MVVLALLLLLVVLFHQSAKPFFYCVEADVGKKIEVIHVVFLCFSRGNGLFGHVERRLISLLGVHVEPQPRLHG